jgi:hypothetical protein
VQRCFRKRLGWNTKILRQEIRWRVSNPIRHQERIELRCVAVIEGEYELGAVGTQALQRVRITGREIPHVALVHIGDIGMPFRVKDGNAA